MAALERSREATAPGVANSARGGRQCTTLGALASTTMRWPPSEAEVVKLPEESGARVILVPEAGAP
eukprot:2958042-Lingulodinium_polyedra.AAC.1